jgi:hypothetical protein
VVTPPVVTPPPTQPGDGGDGNGGGNHGDKGSRPGTGYGDKNHDHSGPPGRSKG